MSLYMITVVYLEMCFFLKHILDEKIKFVCPIFGIYYFTERSQKAHTVSFT